jgi:DnaJ-class molecular chaperone
MKLRSVRCDRCEGRGWIRRVELELDHTPPGEPVTATVTRLFDPECCPACEGHGMYLLR